MRTIFHKYLELLQIQIEQQKTVISYLQALAGHTPAPTKAWTKGELESLTAQINAGKKVSQVEIPGRTAHAIRNKASELGFSKRRTEVK